LKYGVSLREWQGRNGEEGRHTRTFTHGAKKCCKESEKKSLFDSREKLIVSQGKIYV